ncbi:YcxB family protein [Micromonospora sp. NPDC005806]|uniref:YcxB family protein n=1 Tax=Micromonospora sp. NPDC005806 TaxID=3364234 RepID=UPI00367D4B4B
MTVTFTNQPDRKLLGAALRRAFRPRLIFCWSVAALMLLAALLARSGGDRVGMVIFGAGAVVIGLIALWAGSRTVTVNWKLYGLPIVWTVNDEGVRYRSELMDSLVRWPALDRVEAIPAHLIFRVGRYLVLPARVDGLDMAQRAELLAFLHARGLLKEEPERAARRLGAPAR